MKSGEEEELKEVLEKITATSQEMQENMNYIVWSIQPRNDHFDQMVQRMKRYAIEMLQPKEIQVHFTFDEKLHNIKLAPEKRRELFLIFQRAIHNITVILRTAARPLYYSLKRTSRCDGDQR